MDDPSPEHPDAAASGRLAPTALVLAASLALTAWFCLGVLPQPDGSAAVAERTVSIAEGDATTVLASAPVARPGIADAVDDAWVAATAAATGVPPRALRAYAGAEIASAREAPGCGIRWNTLAALGSIESAHGTHAGSSIGIDGVTRPGIFGIDLNGEASARITDTDGGRWDGTPAVDRAVGPMQFIPATWESWGADGNGDGVADPQQIDDAALAAARYLCHHGDLSDATRWRTAVLAYNHLDTYVDAIANAANEYAARAAR